MSTLNPSVTDNYWQMIRGVAIICVVFIHCTPPVEGDSLFAVNLYAVLRNLINFPVALFFFMSGYFALKSANTQDWPMWLKRRLHRILIPALLWSIVYMVFRFCLRERLDLWQVMVTILTGKATSIMYFPLALSIFTLLSPWLVQNANKRAFGIFLACIVCLMILGTFYLQCYHEIKSRTWLAFIVFYWIGMFYKKQEKIISLKKLTWLLFAIIALLLEYVEYHLLLTVQDGKLSGLALSQIRPCAFVYAFAMIGLICTLHKNATTDVKENVLVKVGNMSYSIFFLHLFVIIILNIVYTKLPPQIPWLGFWLAEGSIAVLLCMLGSKVAKRCFPQKLVSELGLD